MRKKSRGMTLLEMMVVLAIVGVLITAFGSLFGRNVTFFRRVRVRQQVMQQSRICMDRIEQILRNARPNTVDITTPVVAGEPVRPHSRIDFQLQNPLPSGANAYAFYLRRGTVFGEEFRPGLPSLPVALASDVTGLVFSGDSTDPSFIGVTLQIDAAYDTTSVPPQYITLLISDRKIHITGSP